MRYTITYTLIVVLVGELLNAQPYAMRAPEVCLGEPCTEPSQVWAVAAMLICCIKPGVLGAYVSPFDLINEAWSMAKIKRLFPYWEIYTLEMAKGSILETAATSAQSLSKEVPALQEISPFDEETKKVNMPQQLRDLLRFILVPDPKKRPSASSVLASREFRDFEHYVSV
jgi:serine/threonine protein kinase